MPLTSHAAARDAIGTKLKTAWDAQTPPVPLMLYDDVKGDVPKDGISWARVQVRHNESNQVTLGEVAGRRFRRFGIVLVQIFTPFGDGLDAADAFAKVANDAFEGEETSPDEVIFRNVRVNEIGQSGDWFQTDVLADFEWDQVK